MKKFLVWVVSPIFVVIIGWFLYQMSPTQKLTGEEVPIVVVYGFHDDMITATSHDLFSNGLIRNERLTDFVIYLLTLGKEQVFKPGTYYVPEGVSTFKVIQKLLGNPGIEIE